MELPTTAILASDTPAGPAGIVYAVFLSLLGVLLILDLFVLNRRAHVIGAAQALRQAGVWVLVALSFNVAVYFMYEHGVYGLGQHPHRPAAVVHAAPPAQSPDMPVVSAAEPEPARELKLPRDGKEAAAMFFQGYMLELMLSLDNMMVIAIIMSFFKVPREHQHRVLFWGIIGAVALRGVMIYLGDKLVREFLWTEYVFGAFLLFTAIKLLLTNDDADKDLNKSLSVRITRRILPLSEQYDGSRFFTRINGRLLATPLFLALVVVDIADTVFAVDSIPAIFGVTSDSFLVLTSNCFAILGLRAIYFAVAALTARFRYLKLSMIVILAYIGVKMLLPTLSGIPRLAEATGGWNFHIPSVPSLIIIVAIMGAGILGSIWAGPEAADEDPKHAEG